MSRKGRNVEVFESAPEVEPQLETPRLTAHDLVLEPEQTADERNQETLATAEQAYLETCHRTRRFAHGEFKRHLHIQTEPEAWEVVSDTEASAIVVIGEYTFHLGYSQVGSDWNGMTYVPKSEFRVRCVKVGDKLIRFPERRITSRHDLGGYVHYVRGRK